MMSRDRAACRAQRDEQGTSLIELALVLPIFMLLLVGAMDFGQAFYTSIELTSAAEAGAAYGLTNVTDTVGMISAAALDANDVRGMTATATWGCECNDGTAASDKCSTTPSCAFNVVKYVDVSTSFSLRSLLLYPAVASSSALTGHSRMRFSAGNYGVLLTQ